MNPSVSTISLVVGLPGDAQTKRLMKALHGKMGVSTDEKLPLINGYTVDVPEAQLDRYLAALPDSVTVMRNEAFLPELPQRKVGHERSGASDEQSMDGPDPAEEGLPEGPLPPVTHPLGWEEVRSQGLDGSGVTLAVIDSGVFPHADFGQRLIAFKNFSWKGPPTPHDEYGHGTHVAGIAGGDGEQIDGVAPKMNLVGARVNSPAEAIKAIDWMIAHKEELSIDIVNLSLGSTAMLPGHSDPFAQAAQRAIDAGILTVVAAGNEAENGTVPGTISTPGILADAITVGAYNGQNTLALEDDRMWGDSSLGPTTPDGLAKPDLVAPGTGIIGTSAQGSELRRSHPVWGDYHLGSGTSMASPMVSGALALMLQVSPSLTQRAAKEILEKTAIPMQGVDVLAQGAGRLDLAAAVEAARAWTPS